jgi:hypothetical protein
VHWILAKRCVVAPVLVAIVVRNRIQLVLAFLRARAQDIAGKVQTLNRELDCITDLPAAKEAALVREALQMNNEDLWRRVDLHLFERHNVVFALGTVPHFITF